MKPQPKQKKKLTLDRERVRVLAEAELGNVQGGNIPDISRNLRLVGTDM